MIFLKAFLLGGLVTVFIQAVFRLTKLNIPTLMMLMICFGGVLTACGGMDVLTNFGRSGMIVSIIDSGEGIFRWTQALLAGDPSSCIMYLVLLALSFVVGLAGGIAHYKCTVKK